jgi:hypothetical protein
MSILNEKGNKNMRPDNFKREEAEHIVYNANPKYLIVGFKSDGLRGLPATFNMVTLCAESEKELFQIIPDFIPPFRVFKISDEGCDSWQTWTERATAESTSKTEAEERALLQKLKDKYEK